MTVVLDGNSSSFIDYTASSIAVSSPTQFWMGGRFRLLASDDSVGSGTLMRLGPSNGGGSVSYAQVIPNTTVKLNYRVIQTLDGSTTNPILSTSNIPITIGEWYEYFIVVDFTAGYVRHYFAGVLVGEHLKPEGATWAWYNFATSAAIPRLTGSTTNGKNWEISDYVGHIGGVITSTEATTFSFAENDPSTLSVPPTWGTEPSGTPGAHAATLEDVYGARDMTQVSGPVSPDAGFPYFSGESSGILTAGVATSTARTISIGADTSVSEGTVYIVGDLSTNWLDAPDDAHILAGKLADGTTSAVFFRSVEMAELNEFLEEFSPAQADAEYLFYVIHDTDDAGDLSNRLSLVIPTKRPVIKPISDAVWRAANNTLLASETGMTWKVVGTAYTATGLATDTNARAEIDLAAYINTGATKDIGDTIDVDVTRSNGQVLAIRDATIVDGDA